METRQLVAFAIILLTLAALVAVYLHATRDFRRDRRRFRQGTRARRLRQRERMDAAGPPS